MVRPTADTRYSGDAMGGLHSQVTFEHQKEAMEAAGQELMDLKLKTGKPLVQDGRRMSVVALAFTLKSVAMLAEWIFDSEVNCGHNMEALLGCAAC